MPKLYGQISVVRLSGELNIVPSNVSSANLKPLTIHPSHDQQVFTPDEEFDGFSMVTAEPVPRIPACVVRVIGQSANVVDHVVNLDVGVSITAEDYVE